METTLCLTNFATTMHGLPSLNPRTDRDGSFATLFNVQPTDCALNPEPRPRDLSANCGT